MKKATPAQIAARKLFAERAKAGTLKKSTRKKARVEKHKIHAPGSTGGTEAAAAKLRLAKKHAARRAKNPIKKYDLEEVLMIFKEHGININAEYFELPSYAVEKLNELAKAQHYRAPKNSGKALPRAYFDSIVKQLHKRNPIKRKAKAHINFRIAAMDGNSRMWYVGQGYWTPTKSAGAIYHDEKIARRLAKKIADAEGFQVILDKDV